MLECVISHLMPCLNLMEVFSIFFFYIVVHMTPRIVSLFLSVSLINSAHVPNIIPSNTRKPQCDNPRITVNQTGNMVHTTFEFRIPEKQKTY